MAVALVVVVSSGGQPQRIQGTRGGTEVELRKMEVNRGFLQIAMTEQNLNGAQIRSKPAPTCERSRFYWGIVIWKKRLFTCTCQTAT